MARWVQRHLLKSIIFCTTFFLALFIDNKNVVFFALGNSNDLPTLFFLFILLIHMQRALASRVTWNDEWLMFGCVVGLGEPQASAPLTTGSEFAIKHAYRWCHQTRDGPKIESRASMNRNCFFFRKKYKWIHDLSQRKSTWRAQVNELKEKRNFAASSCASSTAFFSTNERLQFYMQHVH